ncbi:hypothetical protein [Flavobacterium sp. KACC 22763]|uniref:hypothetical protein n=1 Tax=Flavobacterium sp. KACC 22763 TaxID=3025668 RepID=UPI0023656817|nr:hypothetical protein [Flavobacterium sp. KACC 22763]WDF64357.1 hypothetical protein PQ463_22410 [Flavobacterium sp. KACC 22763]
MIKKFTKYLTVALILSTQLIFCQSDNDGPELGLPGDNLDLYAVMSLFQKSKTIEEFEKNLNLEKTGINNLDLDLDKKVDFIKVVTKKNGNSFTFILQVAVNKKENQDVAVILVDKDKNGKVKMQIVGDELLYGKDYVIEPVSKSSPAKTANPAYAGDDPVQSSPAVTAVVVETVPIVQYVYSPAYVPYYPPYYYGFYPPYFAAFTVMAVGIYRHNHYYHHHGYHGGHYHGGNNVYINNRNNFNNYNNNRSRSNTVRDNSTNNRYNTNRGNSRPSASTRPSAGNSNRAGNTSASGRTRQSSSPSAGTSNLNRGSSSNSNFNRGGSSSSRPSAGQMGGGSRGGGGFSGGGGFGGGGGRRR